MLRDRPSSHYIWHILYHLTLRELIPIWRPVGNPTSSPRRPDNFTASITASGVIFPILLPVRIAVYCKVILISVGLTMVLFSAADDSVFDKKRYHYIKLLFTTDQDLIKQSINDLFVFYSTGYDLFNIIRNLLSDKIFPQGIDDYRTPGSQNPWHPVILISTFLSDSWIHFSSISFCDIAATAGMATSASTYRNTGPSGSLPKGFLFRRSQALFRWQFQ